MKPGRDSWFPGFLLKINCSQTLQTSSLMPIQGPTSYFPTTQAFLNHWADAEAAQGGTPILLDGQQVGTNVDAPVADLQGLFDDLGEARDTVESTALDIGLARAAVAQHRDWLHTQMGLFNDKMRSDHGRSIYAKNLELVPPANSGREAFMKPMRATSRLWQKVNDWLAGLGKPALTTLTPVTRADFENRVTVLRAALDMLEEREQQITLDLAARNAIQDKIYPFLKVYRLKIPTLFAEGSAILESLPDLTPAPGSTPSAPGLAGGWSVAHTRAEFTGTASATAEVTQHQLRGCAQENYDEAIEAVLSTVPVGQPLTLDSTYGLTEAGAIASFRLYAMTATGNEKGSAPVVVSRPL